MKPIPFVGANARLIAPDCDDLPVMRTGTQIVSTWELEPGEVAKLLNGGKIRLSVMATETQPPVALWVE